MREILFRGKRIDNGEWIEGSLSTEYYQNHGVVMISPSEDENYKVDPSTVGQYTGMTDKNDKKIFEGDIYTWKDDYGDYHACLICFGEYFDEYSGKYATTANGFYLKTLKGETFNFAGSGYCEIEISGNIHDNPKLLEEQS